MSKRLSTAAPAKINLGLEVIGKNTWGTHELCGLLCRINLSDEILISFLPINKSYRSSIHVTYRFSLKPKPLARRLKKNIEENPAGEMFHRAFNWALLYFEEYCREFQDGYFDQLCPYWQNMRMEIDVVKKIPSPSGLGGASSDAAALLKALTEYWSAAMLEVNPTAQDNLTDYFLKNCHQLGHDVPFFLQADLQGLNLAFLAGSYQCFPLRKNLVFHGFLMIPEQGFSTASMFSDLKKPLQADSYFKSIYRRRLNLVKKLGLFDATESVAVATELKLFETLNYTSNLANEGKPAGCSSFFFRSLRRRRWLKNDFMQVFSKQRSGEDFLKQVEETLVYLEEDIIEELATLLTNRFSLTHQRLKWLLRKNAFFSMSGSGSAFYWLLLQERLSGNLLIAGIDEFEAYLGQIVPKVIGGNLAKIQKKLKWCHLQAMASLS